MTKPEKKPEIGKNLKIEWKYPKDLKSNFVTNMVVQHRPDYFVVSFFEVWPPTLLGPEEEVLAKLEQIDNIEARCVARLVVTPQTMKEFTQVMSENITKFEEMFAVIEESGKK